MLKRIVYSYVVKTVLAIMYRFYIDLCYQTGRIRWINQEASAAYDTLNTPAIVVFWHGRLSMMPYITRRPAHYYVIL